MVETLIKLVHYLINIFLTILNIILYWNSFIKYTQISKILLVSIGLKSTEKLLHSLLILFSRTKDTHFVWLEASPMVETLIKLVHYLINIFLTILNIILYWNSFIKYTQISKILLVSIGLKSTEKLLHSLLILFSFSCYQL